MSTPRSLLDLFAVYGEWVNALHIKALEEVQLTSECWLSLSKVLTTLVALWYLHTGLLCFDRFIVVFQLFIVELARYQLLYHHQAHASPILWIWRDSSPFWLNLGELNLRVRNCAQAPRVWVVGNLLKWASLGPGKSEVGGISLLSVTGGHMWPWRD